MPRYKISITVDGTNINAVKKQCLAAFGQDVGTQVEKIERNQSRADRLSDAEGLVADAKGIVEGIVEDLKSEIEDWKSRSRR